MPLPSVHQTEPLLGRRYVNDGRALFRLNALQIATRDQIHQKVAAGTYRFEQAPCPICSSQEATLLSEKDRYGLYMPVVACRECGLVRTNPRMDQAAYDDFYELEYRKLYGGVSGPDDSFFNTQMQRGKQIVAYLAANQVTIHGKRVIEVGCGAGGILETFRRLGSRVSGCDLSSDYVEFGRRRYSLDLYQGSLELLPPTDKADLIIYSHVLEHVLDLAKELTLVRERLADNGLVYIEVPGIKSVRSQRRSDFLRLLQNAHTYHFTLASLTNLMQEHGFHRSAGDEFVRSIFLPGNRSPGWCRESDYDSVIAELRLAERGRLFYAFTPRGFKENTRRAARAVLEALHLKEWLNAVVRRS